MPGAIQHSRSSAARGRGADPLGRFRLLATTAAVATFLLVIAGGIVRVSDSGLGCGPAGSGTHGWPLCGGRLVPFVRTSAIVEYTHRILAAAVTALLVALAWHALRRLRERRDLRRGALAAVGIVLFQAALGGLTVEKDLHEALVATHLGVAMVLLALLLGLRWAAGRPRPGPPDAWRAPRIALATGAVLVLATIVAGGVVAGSERHGTAARAANGHEEGAHMACGKEFPTCDGAVLPFGRSSAVDLQLVHRSLMALAVLALLAFVVLALRRGVPARLPAALGGLLAAQVLLGAMNVWLGEHGELVVAHLALGTLLWAAAVAVTLRLTPAPGPAAAD